ncbi:Lrp/AsnC family transcriptional regulator [Methanothrix sp.]|jgi:DNA-binding Lrp family transcriptional regulator|uniref:Lrp/AsnC family transcriptional regulator n=1 Tax=Methanothrix sp. TaxID=90426 RepID=UPI0027B04F89|nr:Lrp/AsnC family transcriptional regulator [Methanothrix soehngenii]MDQ1261852.1 Lrp/AsnC family transcriptional regulator, regulator for asnA, asnC and gidA [Euryarchaeota archaeon]
MKSELDEIDAKIIKALLMDARTSLKDIAEDCGLSSNAIHKRIHNLKVSGVIAGSSTLFNPNIFGDRFTVGMEITVYNELKNDIVKFVREYPDVLMCIEGIGVCDIFAILSVSGVNELDRAKEAIKRRSGVRKVATIIMIDNIQFLFENLDLSEIKRRTENE